MEMSWRPYFSTVKWIKRKVALINGGADLIKEIYLMAGLKMVVPKKDMSLKVMAQSLIPTEHCHNMQFFSLNLIYWINIFMPN
jgi:hypothetical protein